MAIDDLDTLSIWGVGPVDVKLFSAEELVFLKGLPLQVPSVEWLWLAMDRVWQELKLNNRKPLSVQPISDFYSHPVWLANGFFSQIDPVSVAHRSAIASYISRRQYRRIADFGGGFGELSFRIALEDPNINVSIVEPYPSLYGQARVALNPQLTYSTELGEGFDAVIAQDVLEHVEDPIGLAYKLASSVKLGGELIFANCFYPVIECHLPKTFHLRHTFAYHMSAMGLVPQRAVPGASHVQAFRRCRRDLSLNRARWVEKMSRLLGPSINLMRS